jgi:hypothetical protein
MIVGTLHNRAFIQQTTNALAQRSFMDRLGNEIVGASLKYRVDIVRRLVDEKEYGQRVNNKQPPTQGKRIFTLKVSIKDK